MNIEKLKYPIGDFEMPNNISSSDLENCINQIEEFPSRILAITNTLSADELNYIYRPDGWSIKQVVHHCADSHINAFVRTKLALTEILPMIKPYKESIWSNLVDGITDDISDSLLIIKGVHAKWTLLIKSLSKSDLEREFYHPENNKNYKLKELIAIYSWHCNHHLAHIEQALFYKSKFKTTKL